MSERISMRSFRRLALTASLSFLATLVLGGHCGGPISGSGSKLSPTPGLPAYQGPTAVPVPGGIVNAAGANLLVARTDLSIDTRLGNLLAGATWNGADGSWRWTFDLRYDGGVFTDAGGARHVVAGVADGDRIPGTIWRRRGPTTLETLGGLVHEFDGEGLLATMRWASGAHPRLDFESEPVAGSMRIVRVRQCWRAGECADVFTIERDASGRITRIADRAGRAAEFEYDSGGRLLVARDGLDTARGWPGFRYEYDSSGALVALTNSEGERVEYAWGSALGGPRWLARATRIGDGRVREQRFVREDGYVTRYTDSDGQEFVYDCDSQYRLRNLTLPTGETISWAWQGFEVSSLTLPDGATTTWGSEGPDHVVRTTPAGNVVETWFRDEGGENRAHPARRPVVRIEDDLGVVERRKYQDGRLKWIQNGEGERTSFAYDTENMLSGVTLPTGASVSLSEFGESGHPGRVARGSEVETRGYDAVGNLVAVAGASWLHGAAGGVVSRTWDEDRNLSSIAVADSDASGAASVTGEIAIEHRSDGRPLLIERPYGADHAFEYDDLARLVARRERVDGVWQATTFEYDAAGRLVATELANGMRREADFDAAGRLAARRRLRDGAIEGEALYGWIDGRLASVHDSVRALTERYFYDAAGRISAVDFGDGDRLEVESDVRSRTSVERYVASGEVLREIVRSYDLADREIALSAGGSPLLDRSYAAGRQVATAYGNGLVRTTEWDDDVGLLSSASTTDAVGVLETTTLDRWTESGAVADRVRIAVHGEVFDPDFGVAVEDFWLGPVDRPGAPAEAAAGRRVSAHGTSAAGASTLAYDVAGNLVASVPGGGGSGLLLVYNPERNRLTAAVDATTGETAIGYEYDEAGFVTSRAGEAIAWNADGRIASIGSGASFEWDMQGRPVLRHENATLTRYRFGGRVEADGQGAPLRIDLGEVVLEIATGSRRYRHFDFRGNVQFETDDFARIVGRIRYGAYGVAGRDGETDDAVTFAGGRALGDLVVLGARILDPPIARFLGPDPLLQLQNQYAYAGGDPVRFWDPTGLESSPNPALLRAQVDLVAGLAQVSLGASALTIALVTPPPAQAGLLIAGLGFVVHGGQAIIKASLEIREIEREERRKRAKSRGLVGPVALPAGGSIFSIPVGRCGNCRVPGTPPPQGWLGPQSGGGAAGLAGSSGTGANVSASFGLGGMGL